MQAGQHYQPFARLRPLKSVVLEPMNLSGRRNALLQLKGIHSLHVLSLKKGRYEVKVEVLRTHLHIDTTSRIPNDCRVTTSRDTDLWSSTARIERELHDFIILRDSVYNIVRYAHRDRHCDFCGKMTDFLVFGSNPDSLFLKLFGTKQSSSTLRNFVTGILNLTVQYATTTSQCNCTGLNLIPEIVHTFLLNPTAVVNVDSRTR